MATRRNRFYHGNFKPKNPNKYVGDAADITFRSSWELRFMKKLDEDSNIIKWNSEGVKIPYFSIADNKNRKYHLDFLIQLKNGDNVKNLFIEIKPHTQIFEPIKPKRKTKKSEINYIRALYDYSVNRCKWKAANIYAKANNGEFKVVYIHPKTKNFEIVHESELGLDNV